MAIMEETPQWVAPASDESIEKAATALREHNINVVVVENRIEAKEKVISLIPPEAEVMTMVSVTIDDLGISDVINNSGNYKSVKTTLSGMNRDTDSDRMQKLGAAPQWTVGSVHAVTEDGKVFIASNTGSQLPAYAYGAAHVIWVVGSQKIVSNADEALNRIYSYVLPLESERAKKAYGMPGSNVSKLLIINKEVVPDRITMVIVKEALGF